MKVDLGDGEVRARSGATCCAGAGVPVPGSVAGGGGALLLWVGEGGPIELRGAGVVRTRLVGEFYDIGAQFVPG